MQEEFKSLQDNETWELVPLASKRKLVKYKWVYRTKMDYYDLYVNYKAILVSKFLSQFHRVDYTDTFSPVAKMDSIRLVLAIAASKRWEVHHMDVKSEFIHVYLHEDIYMQKHECFIHYPSLFCSLNKALYGLKQSPRAWYAKMDNFILSWGFEIWKYDPNVYLQNLYEYIQIIVMYVDDILITRICIANICLIKSSLHNEFSITGLELLKQFIGLEIEQYDATTKVIQ